MPSPHLSTHATHQPLASKRSRKRLFKKKKKLKEKTVLMSKEGVDFFL
jgi:hypothetical protein